jgi:hypothetical protein
MPGRVPPRTRQKEFGYGTDIRRPPLNKKTLDTDHCWFEEHPTRSYYVRPVLPGEPVSSCPFTYAAIRQIRSGERVQFFIGSDRPLNALNEPQAALVWHWLASSTCPPSYLKALDEREREGRPLQ